MEAHVYRRRDRRHPDKGSRARKSVSVANPHERRSGALSPRTIAEYAWDAGFGKEGSAELVTAVAIALAESGGVVDAENRNSNGTVDRGLWQINSVHDFDARALVTSPMYNADAARQVYEEREARGENGFTAWTAFRSKAYLAHRARAAAGAKEAGLLKQGDIGGNWATSLDEAASRAIPSWSEVTSSVWPVLLQGALATTGLALIGFALVKMLGTSKPAQVVGRAAPVATAVGKAVS